MQQTHELSDEEIVSLVRTSDKELYAEILRRYEKKLLRYTSYILGDENKARDAVQESFIKAYVNLQGFDTNKKFSSWIYRIAHNEAMNIVSKYTKQRSIDVHEDFDSGIDLEEEIGRAELLKQAQNCMQEVPLLYKEPLMLYYFEEKNYDEISDILRIPIGTVGTRISRGKGLLKKICQNKT